MLGVAHIRQWAMLMVVDDVAEATQTQLAEALTRARLCQNVAATLGAVPDAAFMAGLITSVAGMLGLSPAAMAHQLPLSTEIADALARGAGPLGQVLRVVNAYERGDLAEVAAAYTGGDLTTTVLAAMRWSRIAVQAAQTAA
jgi:c-di-GMP-related signal transduction protein